MRHEDSAPAPTIERPLRIVEAAQALGVHDDTFRRIVAAGEIATIRVGGRRMIAADELRRFAREGARETGAAA